MHFELISLRYLEQKTDLAIVRHIKQILEQGEILQDWDIRIFKRERMFKEILIGLASKKHNQAKIKSNFGVLLADSLKPFGSVNHDVWSEIQL